MSSLLWSKLLLIPKTESSTFIKAKIFQKFLVQFLEFIKGQLPDVPQYYCEKRFKSVAQKNLELGVILNRKELLL